MLDYSESVHVHRMDADSVIEEYRQKGFILKERGKPTIPAQMGFERLVFVPAEYAIEVGSAGKTSEVGGIKDRATSYAKFLGKRLKAD